MMMSLSFILWQKEWNIIVSHEASLTALMLYPDTIVWMHGFGAWEEVYDRPIPMYA